MSSGSVDRLTPQLFLLFRHLVEEGAGLHQRPEDAPTFGEKVVGRMREAGFESALDYYYRLRYDDPAGDELAALIDALVVGETYFFREMTSLAGAIEHVVRPAVDRRGAARIWSAACASGEEPLTIAMLLGEAGLLDRCDILATDVSRRAIARATAAVYGGRSLRALAEDDRVAAIAKRWLNVSDGVATPRPALRGHIAYERLNLIDPPLPREAESFDLVLCRNVLIYFSDDTIRSVVHRLARALRPGGRLLVGASESLLRFGTELRCEERSGIFYYVKEAS